MHTGTTLAPGCVVEHYRGWLDPATVAFYTRILKHTSFTPVPVAFDTTNKRRRRAQRYFCDDLRYFSEAWVGRHAQWRAHPVPLWARGLQRRAQRATDALRAPGLRRAVYNSAHVNFYENGSAGIGPHCDTQPAWGTNPTIAVVSIGATRTILFEPLVADPERPRSMRRDKSRERVSIALASGDLLVMGGGTQRAYCHSIAAEPGVAGPRWSITYRSVDHDRGHALI